MNLTSRFQGNVAFEKIDGNLAVLCGNVAYLATWPCIQIRPLLTTWSARVTGLPDAELGAFQAEPI